MIGNEKQGLMTSGLRNNGDVLTDEWKAII